MSFLFHRHENPPKEKFRVKEEKENDIKEIPLFYATVKDFA